jgi:bacterioferritin
MQGDVDVIAVLNEQLTAELTAINQYFLHAKMQENWGYTKLAKHTRAESYDEMRHAERLAERILFLEGLPNFQRISPLHIGQTVPEQLRADLVVEMEAVARLKSGIDLMRSRSDVTSARLFEDILDDEEEHIDYLETEIALVDALGEPLYLQRYAQVPDGDLRARHRGEVEGRVLSGFKP